jgi:hypothetical protein
MFGAAFDAAETSGSEDAATAEEQPQSGEAPIEEPTIEDVASTDEDDDDLERAMRSLFPVLEQGKGDAAAADAGERGTSEGAEADSPEPSEATSPPASESGTQFDAIKQDVQSQAQAQTSESAPASEQEEPGASEKKKKKRDDEASTEEIEKIWSILEDMD